VAVSHITLGPQDSQDCLCASATRDLRPLPNLTIDLSYAIDAGLHANISTHSCYFCIYL